MDRAYNEKQFVNNNDNQRENREKNQKWQTKNSIYGTNRRKYWEEQLQKSESNSGS